MDKPVGDKTLYLGYEGHRGLVGKSARLWCERFPD